MKQFYLVAAVVGAVVPYLFYGQHMVANGSDFMQLIATAFATPANVGFTADLVLASIVFWVFMWHRRRLGHGPGPALFIALTVVIGLACALPAYLYAMEAGRGAESP